MVDRNHISVGEACFPDGRYPPVLLINILGGGGGERERERESGGREKRGKEGGREGEDSRTLASLPTEACRCRVVWGGVLGMAMGPDGTTTTWNMCFLWKAPSSSFSTTLIHCTG